MHFHATHDYIPLPFPLFQWRSLPPVAFVIYRSALAGYCVIWLIWSAIKDVIICRQSYTFILFLTNWILVALTIQTTLAAVSTFYHHVIRARHRRYPRMYIIMFIIVLYYHCYILVHAIYLFITSNSRKRIKYVLVILGLVATISNVTITLPHYQTLDV